MKNLTKAYQLQILPNFHKIEDIRYSASRYKLFLSHFITQLKQLLDVEVTRALRRSKVLSCNLIIEHPKCLANLKLGKLGRWAKSYFGNRLQIRSAEEGVFVQWINPRNTSITCSKCGQIDRRSRVKQSTFKCVACGNTVNADLNAAFNIAAFELPKQIKECDDQSLIERDISEGSTDTPQLETQLCISKVA